MPANFLVVRSVASWLKLPYLPLSPSAPPASARWAYSAGVGSGRLQLRSRPDQTLDRISERPPPGGLSVCPQRPKLNSAMSAIGTKRTCDTDQSMSAFGGIADTVR